IREVGVQRHAGGEGDGIIGINPHDQRGHRRRNASGKKHAIHRHAAFRKDLRVHHDDVSHSHECREARQQFAAHRALVFFQPKSNLQSCALAPDGSSFRTIYELASIPQLRIGCLSVLLLFFSPWTPAQTKVQHSAAPQTEGERRGTLNLHAARSNPLQLRNLLKKMPKGADLHNHLSGAVYAESWIRAAAEDQLCVNVTSLSFAKPGDGSCGSGKVPAADAYKDQSLYDALIDAFSMRGFVPSPGVTGHDHFFQTFEK